MSDDERLNLERKLRELNSRTGLTSSDAAYLLEYLQLCDRVMENARAPYETIKPLSVFVAELAALNERFKTQVGAEVIRTKIATFDALSYAYAAGCWSESTKECTGGNGGEFETVAFLTERQP